MVRYTLEISLEPHDSRVYGNDKRWVAYQKGVLGALRPLADQAWGSNITCFVDAESPRAPELLAVIEDLRKRKVAKPLGQCEIAEQLLDNDDSVRLEWFEITHWPLYGYTWVQPRPLLEYGPPPDPKKWPALARAFVPRVTGGLKSVYASRQRPGRHLAEGGMSEQVKALVEREGLSGLELLWLPDAGRAEAMQWYLPIPTEPLGRGMDHPWFDPASLNCEGRDPNRATNEPSDPMWRYGVRCFGSNTARPDVRYDEAVKDAAIALTGGFVLGSYRRVLRRYLPQTDFAYAWEWVEDNIRGRRRYSWRHACCNRQTRDLLIEEGLGTEEDFLGIAVLDETYGGAEVLDELPGGPRGPGPYFTPEEMADLREELERWQAEYLAKRTCAAGKAGGGKPKGKPPALKRPSQRNKRR